jgi:signal peptidase
MNRPILMTAVRSNSMYPLFQKGDMVFLNPFFSKYKIKLGDIIIFKTEGGSYDTKGWIVHRVINGNSTNGFITKGDANEYTDQSGDNPSIKSEWIT